MLPVSWLLQTLGSKFVFPAQESSAGTRNLLEEHDVFLLQEPTSKLKNKTKCNFQERDSWLLSRLRPEPTTLIVRI